MINKVLRILCLAGALAAAACTPPPATSALPDWVAPVEPPPRARGASPAAASAKSASVRPRLLGLSLEGQRLSPARSPVMLDQALFGSDPSASLRGAGLSQLAELHLRAGRPEAALAAARGGHDLARQAYGDDHVETLTALTALGEVLGALGRDLEAETTLVVATERSRRVFGAAHPVAEAAADRLEAHRRAAPGRAPLLRSLSRRLAMRG